MCPVLKGKVGGWRTVRPTLLIGGASANVPADLWEETPFDCEADAESTKPAKAEASQKPDAKVTPPAPRTSEPTVKRSPAIEVVTPDLTDKSNRLSAGGIETGDTAISATTGERVQILEIFERSERVWAKFRYVNSGHGFAASGWGSTGETLLEFLKRDTA